MMIIVFLDIPDREIKENFAKELYIYNKLTKKVSYVTFNPMVDNVLSQSL